MKYLMKLESFTERLFEGFEPQKIKFNNKEYSKIYWLLPNDNRLKKALNKINCNKAYLDRVLTRPVYRLKPYLFIGYDGYGNYEQSRWGWCEYEGTLKHDFYESEGYEFGGAINMDYESEIIANKYNI